ncbi:hypothetical protein [Sphingopyxis sp. NFH-91]|uniref:hypothetical protein n=1 Tax=Sphingopyxis sp. NFH-91 TaxID=2744457 RepID=UPI001F470FD6|nr:hypothetical protein [Sphingopyxis sp. NFH-91]
MFSFGTLASLGGAVAFIGLSVALKGRPLIWIVDLVDWLTERPVRLLIAVLAIAAVAGWWSAWSIDGARDKLRTSLTAERKAHMETKERVAAAALGAQDLANANKVDVETKWRDQYQEAQHANEILRERNRALLAQWLRPEADRADPGRSGEPGLSCPAAMPAGSVYDAGTAIVPVADLARTADAFAQLEALIGFVTAAAAVPTSPAPATVVEAATP